jgi:mRNA interferase HigB
MEIRGLEVLAEFVKRHQKARKPLNRWMTVVKTDTWTSLADFKKSYNTVDYIREKGLYCFDIGGNNYRLLSVISFRAGFIVIEHIFTHTQYDKWNKTK